MTTTDKSIKILCGCQSYFGLKNLNAVLVDLEHYEPPVQISIVECPIVDEYGAGFDEFTIEIEYKDQFDLLRSLTDFATEMEARQCQQFGDSGGVWIKQVIEQ